MKVFKFIYLFIFFCHLQFCTNKNDLKKEYTVENGNQKEVIIYQNKMILAIVRDSLGRPIVIRSSISDSLMEEIRFGKNGRALAKLSLNWNSQLNGQCYYYYPSGYLRSIRTYKNDTLTMIGKDFYDLSGIEQKYIYYDSLGEFYYFHYYSDTSMASDIFYNEKNPRTYLLISKNAPEPTRTMLMKRMEKIGLDSLKQLH